ncbi:MAG: STAS domain-containing protein [Microthrixaceae bacterium]
MLFDVRSHEEGATTVVSVVGDVDLASLPRFAEALSATRGPTTIDLTGVDFFDPVCLGVLVAADLRSRREGTALGVIVGAAVGSLLAEARLEGILKVVHAG